MSVNGLPSLSKHWFPDENLFWLNLKITDFPCFKPHLKSLSSGQITYFTQIQKKKNTKTLHPCSVARSIHDFSTCFLFLCPQIFWSQYILVWILLSFYPQTHRFLKRQHPGFLRWNKLAHKSFLCLVTYTEYIFFHFNIWTPLIDYYPCMFSSEFDSDNLKFVRLMWCDSNNWMKLFTVLDAFPLAVIKYSRRISLRKRGNVDLVFQRHRLCGLGKLCHQ